MTLKKIFFICGLSIMVFSCELEKLHEGFETSTLSYSATYGDPNAFETAKSKSAETVL